MKKVCWACQTPKKFPAEFNAQGKICLECHKKRERDRRASDREAYNASIRERRRRSGYPPQFSLTSECKTCGKCKTRKSPYCEACARARANERSRSAYAKKIAGKQAKKQKRKEKRKTIFAFLRDFKKKHPCVRCGISDYRCLTFHHVGKKTFELSCAADRNVSLRQVINEIAKCIVLCANCHTIEHFVEH
jgi:hypothetical protein